MEAHRAATAPTPTPTTQTHSQTQGGLRFSNQAEYLHHLYKLEIAKFKSNKAPDGFHPDWQDNEHVHWFHTINSDGKTQVRTNSVGGHYHKMEVLDQGPDLPPIVTCVSGPLKEVSKLQYGRRVKFEVPVNDVDNHSHDTTYVKSNVIVERIKNIEAAKAEAAIMARSQSSSIPGISTSDE